MSTAEMWGELVMAAGTSAATFAAAGRLCHMQITSTVYWYCNPQPSLLKQSAVVVAGVMTSTLPCQYCVL